MCRKLKYLVSFVLVLGLFLTNVAEGVDPSLVGWWTFDDGSGTVAKDLSGNGVDATFFGEPTWGTEAGHGGILLFDGTTTTPEYVLMDGSYHVPVYTITLWFRVEDGSGQRDIFSAYAPGVRHGILLELGGEGNLRYLHRYPLGTGGGTNIYTSTTYGDGAWYHAATVKSVDTIALYINGELVDSVADTSVFNPGDTFGVVLGILDHERDPARLFPGAMDDVRIYDRALTQDEIQFVMQGKEWPFAFGPDPADGALHPDTWASLSWSAGAYAVSHDVYFGGNFADVEAGTEGTFQGNQTATWFRVGSGRSPCLIPGTTYYWRIDEVNDTEPNSPWIGDVWRLTVPPKTAYAPDPADGAKFFIDPNVTLSWTAGFGAKLHTVYFDDDFANVKDADTSDTTGIYRGVQAAITTYTPGSLELEKTYYWRVDEFDGIATYKGDVWSFTTMRADGGWRYDGGILVGVYYYPWYGSTGSAPIYNSLRCHLVPRQTPELGEYDSSSPAVIAKHIDYSHRANIHFWVCSWWGPGTYVDYVLRNRILPHRYAGELKYTILYESVPELGDKLNPNYTGLLADFDYLASNYFDNPKWLKINGRPVVFIYVAGLYFNETQGYPELEQLRQAHPNLYIIADDIYGRFDSDRASKWDAVTVYGVYGKGRMYTLGSTHAALDQLESAYDEARAICNSVNVGFVPAAGPGYNNRVARAWQDGLMDGPNGVPRYFEDDPTSVEGDLFRAMLREVVVPKHIDPLAQNMLVITSFNEWYEDSQIEPTMGTVGTTKVDDSSSGSKYTQGDYYTDYGYLYLDILRQETCFLEGDSLSDALDTALSFTTGGSADWFSQTTTSRYDGDAARSGNISHSQDSWMQTTVSGTGTIRFYWRVSSEEDFDFLEFYIDGSLQEKISGSEDDWERQTYTISTSGSHTLEWRYMKDGSGDEGSDCGWVDKVQW